MSLAYATSASLTAGEAVGAAKAIRVRSAASDGRSSRLTCCKANRVQLYVRLRGVNKRLRSSYSACLFLEPLSGLEAAAATSVDDFHPTLRGTELRHGTSTSIPVASTTAFRYITKVEYVPMAELEREVWVTMGPSPAPGDDSSTTT